MERTMAWRAPVRPEHERSDRQTVQAVKGLRMCSASAGVDQNAAAPTLAPTCLRRTKERIGRRGALIALSPLTGVFYVAGPAPRFSLRRTAGAVKECGLAGRTGSAQTEHAAESFQDERYRARREQWLQRCRDTRR